MSDKVREYVEKWLADERDYTLDKFGLVEDDDHLREGFGWWEKQFWNYFTRAQVLGLDTPAGRQAAAKFTATALGFLETVVRLYGALPEPGVPSGYNMEELRTL